MAEFIAVGIMSIIMLVGVLSVSINKKEKISLEERLSRNSTVNAVVKINNKVSYLEKLKLELYQSRSGITLQIYFLIAIVAGIVFYVVTVFLVESPFIGIIAACFGYIIPKQVVSFLQEIRQKEFDMMFTKALKRISASLRSSSTLLQAVEDVKNAENMSMTIREEMALVLMDYEYGNSMDKAFYAMYERTGVDDIRGISLSIEIAERQGSKLFEAIDSYVDAIMLRKKMEAEGRAALSNTKVSVTILSIAPFAFSGLIKIISPNFFDEAFLFMGGLGKLIIFALYIVVIIGFVIIRKMCNVRI